MHARMFLCLQTLPINNSQNHVGQTLAALLAFQANAVERRQREDRRSFVTWAQSTQAGLLGVTVRSCQGSEVGLVVASRQQLSSIKTDLVYDRDVVTGRYLSDLNWSRSNRTSFLLFNQKIIQTKKFKSCCDNRSFFIIAVLFTLRIHKKSLTDGNQIVTFKYVFFANKIIFQSHQNPTWQKIKN